MKILILSTAHPWNDPRIFHKQACTLAKEHEVTLAAVDDGSERVVRGVRLRPLGTWKSHSDRVKLWWRAYREIFRAKADAIHFHDPELALILLPFAFFGNKRLVYDVHEDPYGGYGKRPWIPKLLQKTIVSLFIRFLVSTPYIYDATILAEDSYTESFPERHNVHKIRNYALIPNPDVPFFDRYENFNPHKELRILYLGQLIRQRGALEMIEMAKKLAEIYPGFTLDLIGEALPPAFSTALQQAAAESEGRVKLHGYLDFSTVSPFLEEAHIGLIPLHPHPNNLKSIVTKFFDYMTYGLPCVASNFPLWQRFLTDNPCGVTADPLDPDSFVEAIVELVESPDKLRELSRAGYQLVREKFRWEFEGERLLQIYRIFSG